MPSVAGGSDKTNRWAYASWNYYAHGFPAKYPNDGNIFCGVFAGAEVSHSQSAWDGQKSGYVYDGVSATAIQIFDIAIGPLDESVMDVEDFPFTVKVNTFMEIGGTSSVDMGRCSAYFSLELKKLTGGSFRVLYAKAELVAEPESNDPLFSVCDDPIGLSKVKIGADHKYSTFVFDNIKLKPNTIYRATLSLSLIHI